MPAMSAARFFYERHRYVLHYYLPRYQYVLHLDADSLVLNLSKPLEAYFKDNSHRHAHDVHLHMHENGEVTAAAYLLKNSGPSRCFLQLWADFSPPHSDVSSALTNAVWNMSSEDLSRMTYEVSNYDNGDLVAAVTNLLAPHVYKAHLLNMTSRSPEYFSKLQNAYHETMVHCFTGIQATLPRRLSRRARFLRIYLPREGFWRTHARKGRFGKWWDDLFGNCYSSSDIIGHGWKAMSRQMWGVPADSPARDDSVTVPTPSCDLPAIRAGRGANKMCTWMSAEKERDVARDFCMYQSPVCVQNTTCRSDYEESGRSDSKYMTSRTFVRNRLAECNACLGVQSACAARRAVGTGGDGMDNGNAMEVFGVQHEAWWKGQMCATCPP